MRPISFGHLMEWILAEHDKGSVFGVKKPFFAQRAKRQIFGRGLEVPFGPAAGPHTQLAQNIIAGYVAGARFFELKTVQKLAGDDLQISKPCIKADDECYNVEWSTELTVEGAFAEYAKAWIALHVLALEYGYGATDGFQFNMSVGYDLEGIKSPIIDTFIENLKDASQTAIFQECIAWLQAHRSLFKKVDAAALAKIPSAICNSITVSTMHGCPPAEIERIGMYLLKEKQLNTFIKCNPTLLGYEFVRQTLDALGYGYMTFDDHHFKADLQYVDAVPMLQRLQGAGQANGLLFGVKLTNTFPVEIKHGELPGDAMYMSGKPLFFLSLATAKLLSEAFAGKLPMSYSGGADYFNAADILATGIWPITVATTLLKPGGYERIGQISSTLAEKGSLSQQTDTQAIEALWQQGKANSYYQKLPKIRQVKKLDKKLPLTDCFTAPCQSECPIHQDISAYMELVGKGEDAAALRLILEKNPLPFITGTVCYHTCMNRCNRNFYEAPVDIRKNKLKAAIGGYAAVMGDLPQCAPARGKKAAIVGGGPAGLAAAYFLQRGGIAATVFEKQDKMGGAVRYLFPAQRITPTSIDKDIDLIGAFGVQFVNNREITDIAALQKEYDFVILAIGAAAAGLNRLRQPNGEWLSGKLGDFYKKAGLAMIERGRPQVDAATMRSSQENVYIIGDGCKGLSSVVLSISDAQRAADAILAQTEPPVVVAAVDDAAVYKKRGELSLPTQDDFDGRCLNCDVICENCVEVCPNRANVALQVPGLRQHQILHLDSLCNECGNCRSFCPWQGAPYQDKLTLFANRADMESSKNQGFVVTDRKMGECHIRLGEAEFDYKVGSNDSRLDLPVKKLIDAVFDDYAYLLEED